MIGNLALNPQTFLAGLALAAVLSAATAGGAVWYVRGLQIDVIKSKHATEAAQMETKVVKAEGDANKFKLDFVMSLEEKRNELDQKYDERVAAVNASVSKLANIRLRDPAANSNSGTTGGQGNAQGNNGSDADSGGLLSPQASQFLWSFAGESQIYLDRLNQCKAWNTELEAQSKKYYEEIQELRKQNLK